MKIKIILLSAFAASVTGCTTYHPLQLDDKVTLITSVSHLTVDTHTMPFQFLAAHKFDPTDGLDMTEVAMLAVANNPDLKLARDDAGIGHAQAFAAGLLPDPQLNIARDIPLQPGPGVVKSYSAGVGFDFGSLITHAASSSAGRFDSQKIDLNLLWQEWQVVARARLLFSRAIAQENLLRWLTDNRDLLAERYAKAKSALDDGNLARDAVNSTLSVWQDALRQVNDLQRQQLQTRHDLNALLGLSPEVELKLVTGEVVGVPDDKEVEQAITILPARRPDLLALKAGYAAEDARYRQAILAQFPPFNFAFTRSSDNFGVAMEGVAMSIALPIFNGNRGNIRIEEATRQRLHDEYQIRLDTAYADVKRLVADSRLIAAQLQASEAGLDTFDQASTNAVQAFSNGDLDWNGYAIFQSSRIARHVEVTNLHQALLENRIALFTLLGGNFDTRTIAMEKHQ
ncbi:MAG: Outer membrane efflux protein CusC [Candidatus Gallionella acididurans]|uniref:Outer membrane efflux protein CusC n=1 Tax=Candidatus Gallionella acididurans TaxID=1796491 RepID=A0A139BUZ5_9PROT|nr:MAG: Outer membrane efflux protein CusC [Candidatus Gallionella acididurans]